MNYLKFIENIMDQLIENKQQKIPIHTPDEVLTGSYSNMMQVAHTKEEFILDFLNVYPPKGVLASRVILSPGHLKRIINALQGNLDKYEEKFGKVEVSQEPGGVKMDIG